MINFDDTGHKFLIIHTEYFLLEAQDLEKQVHYLI